MKKIDLFGDKRLGPIFLIALLGSALFGIIGVLAMALFGWLK